MKRLGRFRSIDEFTLNLSLAIIGVIFIALVLTITTGIGDVKKGNIAKKFSGGAGLRDDPYLVASRAELARLAREVNRGNGFSGRYFRMTEDIDIDGQEWTPIGNADAPFMGCFDGDGHTILNLSVNLSETEGGGLFGRVTGEVANLEVDGADIYARSCVGAVVAHNEGTIKNVTARVALRVNETCAGGIVGLNDGVIENVTSSGIVRGESALGGLVGDNKGIVRQSLSKADVRGGENDVGGVAGVNDGQLRNISSCGIVDGSFRVGGIAGFNNGTIENCAAAGAILGVEVVGGLVGDNRGSVLRCLSSGRVSGVDVAGGLIGFNDGSAVRKCLFDVQGSGLGNGIGWNRTDWAAVSIDGLDTATITGRRGTASALGNGWTYARGRYPAPVSSSLLSNVPLYLARGDSTSSVTESFSVPMKARDGSAIQWAASPGALIIDSYGQADIVCSGVNDVILTAIVGDERKIFNLTIRSPRDDIARGERAAAYYFAGGDGSAKRPYEIADARELECLARFVNGGDDCRSLHFKLTGDIDLNTVEWRPIGLPGCPFMGAFDGSGRKISGLRMNSLNEDIAGLFGCIGDKGLVSALRVEDGFVAGRSFVGLLAGHNKGVIRNCAGAGSVIGASFNVGGIAGVNHGSMEKCDFTGRVEGAKFGVGGITGVNYGRLDDGSSSCDVTGDADVGGLTGVNIGTLSHGVFYGGAKGNKDVGGLVGINEKDGTVHDSSSLCSVQGGARIGGLAGNNNGDIRNSAANCDVSAVEYVGGLVGQNYAGEVSNCAASGRASGSQYVGGLVGINLEGVVFLSAACTDVSGDFRLGGLVGGNHDIVRNCASSGSVTGREDVGGLVGNNVNILVNAKSPLISNSMACGSVVTKGNGGGIAGVSLSPIVGCVFDADGALQMFGVGSGSRSQDVSTHGMSVRELTGGDEPIEGLGGEWTYKARYYPQPKGLADNDNPEVRAISGLCAVPLQRIGAVSSGPSYYAAPGLTADGKRITWTADPPEAIRINSSGMTRIRTPGKLGRVILKAEAGGKAKIFKL
ncbi:MAG: hypothetical protein LBT31_09655 [Synergistaceae bacterium]|nr:hypothetical protein [Synergistaceae bacterium]